MCCVRKVSNRARQIGLLCLLFNAFLNRGNFSACPHYFELIHSGQQTRAKLNEKKLSMNSFFFGNLLLGRLNAIAHSVI